MFKQILFVALFAAALGVPYKKIHPKQWHGRIVGGEETTIEKFPYQVSFRIYDQHFCGGTIIDEYTVLTAAHCTEEFRPTKMSVMVGSANVEEGVVHKVADYYQHPLYDEFSYDYDISIIKLSTPIIFNNKAKSIELQDEGVEVDAGVVATISGWGDKIENDEEYTKILRKVDVDIISKEECKDAYEGSAEVTDRMLCASRPGKDSCQGDSGGPLVANNKLIGIVSWAIGCARPQYPRVYTKISNLRRWIDENK